MKKLSLIAGLVALAPCAIPCQAAVVTYAIDSLASSLTLSGNASGFPLIQQSVGSMIDAFSGTITGDLVGGALTFSGGSVITALLNPASPFVPAGAGVDNYGVTLPELPGGGTIAFRDMVFDFTAGNATNGSPSTATIAIPAGSGDYNIPALGGVGSLALNTVTPALNASGSNVTITTVGETETLTFPVNVTFTGNVNSTFAGTLVATRAIPEPATFILALTGLAGILRRRKY